MRILVTGAAGFIGSHLTDALLAAGHEVVGFDDFNPYYDPRIKWSNLQGALAHPSFRLVVGDIRDVSLVTRTLQDGNWDHVVHLAARAGVRPSIVEPALYYEVNCTATAHLFEACRRVGARNITFASSSSVYGGNEKVPFSEADPVDHPVSPYAATKKAGELLAHTYCHLYGLNITCLRFFTVYGPRQRPEMAIHKFIDCAERGAAIPVFGDGTSGRDYTYVDDIVAGIRAAMDETEGYAIYNLGNSSPVLLSELIAKIEDATGRTALRAPYPPQPGDVERTWADISLATQRLGYRPTTDIDTGLREMVSWYRFDARRK
jgi:UDP-glucuronate 4-epimerase